jgi:hypothetical protein
MTIICVCVYNCCLKNDFLIENRIKTLNECGLERLEYLERLTWADNPLDDVLPIEELLECNPRLVTVYGNRKCELNSANFENSLFTHSWQNERSN